MRLLLTVTFVKVLPFFSCCPEFEISLTFSLLKCDFVFAFRWSIMSVKSHAAQSELALKEAPSVSEQQVLLGEQIADLRRRLVEFLKDEHRLGKIEQLHRE